MTPKSFLLTDQLADYLAAHNPAVDDVVRDLVAQTQALGAIGGMQIAPEQGAFLTLLTKLMGVRSAIEVGTFTGYSSLCIARGMEATGHLLCCDISEEWTSIARRYWQRAGLTDRIELRLAPALETLNALPSDRTIDLAFIDADKAGYISYYEALVPRIRSNGVILVDNVLWSGRVIDSSDDDEDTVAIRAFNYHVSADARVEAVMTPISDGLTIIRVR